MTFQIIVVSIAVICLITALTFVGYSLYTYQHHKKYPPVSSACPDYWVSKNDKCYNEKHLGTCNNSPSDDSKDFNNSHFKGHKGDCNKSKWANQCNLSWDGITNMVDVCK